MDFQENASKADVDDSVGDHAGNWSVSMAKF